MPMAKIGLMLHETITDFSYDVYFKKIYFQRNLGRRSNPGMSECKQNKQEI